MRRKMSTILEEQLYRRLRLEALRQGRRISELLGEALTRYLDESGTPEGVGGVVRTSWGALKLDFEKVKAIMEDEDGLFDD